MKLGDSTSVTRAFSDKDASAYAELAKLTSPPKYTPEPLIGGLFSFLLGVELPGPGTNYLKQDLHFYRRLGLGEPISARVTVTRLRPEKQLVDLATTAHDSRGNLICDGRALVLITDVQDNPPVAD